MKWRKRTYRGVTHKHFKIGRGTGYSSHYATACGIPHEKAVLFTSILDYNPKAPLCPVCFPNEAKG